MLQELPQSCKWISFGDFNIVESAMDKSSIYGRQMPLHEGKPWDEIKETFVVEDNFSKTKGLIYFWDNPKMMGKRPLIT
jgi:hypothetical protein